MPNNLNNWSNVFSKWIVGPFSETVTCTPLDLQMLEDRVLYSAGPIPFDLIHEADPVQTDFSLDVLATNEVFQSVESQFDLATLAIEAFEMSDLDDGFSAEPPSNVEPNELIIVDTSIEGYQQLVDDLFNSQTTDRNAEVVFLDNRTDGVRQISDILNKRSNLDAIHLISHGRDGTLELGTSQLDLSSLSSYEEDIIGWRSALAIDADLLIYGCNVAESLSGEEFVDRLSTLLQADVVASNDVTGSSDLGGDWTFEYQVGFIETSIPFSTSIQSDWFGTLAAQEMSSDDVAISGSASRAIAVDFDGRVTQVFTSDTILGSIGNDIYMVKFDVDGTQLGPAQKVNTSDVIGDQHNASIAMNDDGDYVVVWTSDDLLGNVTVKGKIFSTTAAPMDFEVGDQSALSGGALTIPLPLPVGVAASSAISDASNASVAMNASGDFIVAWEGNGTEDADGIYAQRFQLDGTAIDDLAFIVNGTLQAGYQGSPDVAINATGEFIVGWDTSVNTTTEGSVNYAVYDATRTILVGDEEHFKVPSAYYVAASVDIDDSLNYAITASGNATFSWPGFVSQNVRLTAFEYDGISGWTESTTIAPHDDGGNKGDQYNSSVAIVDNEVIITWEGEETSGGDIAGVYIAAYDLQLNELQSETHLANDEGPVQTTSSITKFHGGREWAIGWLDSNLGHQHLIGNELPEGNDNSINLIESQTYNVVVAEFGYDDSNNGHYADNDPFTSVEIIALPSDGDLIYDGTIVSIGDILLVSEIEFGKLDYVPNFGFVGNDNGFEFKVSDGFQFSVNTNTITFDVNAASPSAPSDLSGGIEINVDGGNDAYFLTQDTSFLDGLGDFVVELAFSSTNTATTPLISYQTTDQPDGPLYHNDFLIQYNTGGTITVYLPGGAGGSDINNLSGIDYSSLMDGQKHSVAFSFDTSSGDWIFFVDGAQTDNGTSTLFQNTSFNGGGSLVLGQEQDAPNADFDSNEYFQGTLHDVRFWDRKYGTGFDFDFLDQKVAGSVPAHLIAAWQFEDLVAGTTVANFVDSGNPLVLNHVGEPGFSTSNPSVNLTVGENAPNDLVVGTLVPTDSNRNESFSFSLINDAGGRFEIDSSTGEVKVLDGSQLDFETNQSHSIMVRVDDGTFAYDELFTINLVDVNEAPGATNNGMSVGSGTSANTITTAMLNESDVDAGDSGTAMVYTMTTGPTNGDLLLSGTVLSNGQTFTQDDIDNNRITYNHTAGTLVDDSFDFSLADGGENGVSPLTGTFVISVVNQAPTVGTNLTLTVDEGGTIAITNSFLNEGDPDDDGSELTYTIGTTVANGTLFLNTTALDDGDTFTQADIDNGFVTYEHDGNETTSDSFTFTLADGGEDSVGTAAATFNLDVTPVNDQVIIGTGTGISFDEGSSNNTISSTMITASDADDNGANLIVKITAVPTNGDLRIGALTLVNGSTFSYADIQNNLLKYDHDGDETLADAFSFTIEDGGENGTTPVGGTFGFTINPVNDAPAFGPNTPATVDEGSTGNIIDDSNLKENDPDDDGAELTYQLTDDVDFGELRLDGTLLTVNDTFTQADVIGDKLTYNHDGTDSGISPTDSFSFTFADGGEDGVPTGVGSFTININPVDDAPVANSDAFNTLEDTPLTTGNLLANDTDEENDDLLVAEYTQTSNGTVSVNSDGSFVYTPDLNFNGTDSFEYTMVQSQSGLVHHWGMNGDGVDLIGGNLAMVEGATPVASDNGTGLQFDEVDDYVEISDVELDSDFTISFDFKVDANSGNAYQYLYSQGTVQTPNSLNIYFGEDTSAFPGILKTAIFDGNDPNNGANRNALNIDINALVGDSQWHEYSLVVEQGVGVKVFIDGVESANSTHAEDGAVLNQDIFLGKRNDDNANRYFGGALDSLQIFDRALTDSEITDPAKGLFTATAVITVDPDNDAPIAHDNIYGVSVGQTINIGIEAGLLYNDSDVDGDAILATLVTTQPTNGIVSMNADGTFSYTHSGLNANPDSFEYQVSDGNGGLATATVYIHVDVQGLTSTDEFLAHDSSLATQDTHQSNSTFSDSAVAVASNGDYVVTWTSYAGGEENVLLQRYDFSGNRIGEAIDVSAELSDGDNHAASTSMADDGRFVVVWSNQFTTASNDGTTESVYFQLFNADGTKNGSTTRITDAAFSAGEQVSPDVSMNASGQFAITWDGEGAGGLHNVFLNMFESDGTSITSGAQKINSSGVGGGLEYNASVVMGDDGMVYTAWDDGNTFHGKVFDQFGNPGAEFIPPAISGVVGISHSSLDVNDSGLVALAYQIEVDDGLGGTNWESHLQILDMSDPVIVLNPTGNQTFSGSQINPSVSFGDDDSLVMTWQGEGAGDNDGVFARKFRIEYTTDGHPYAEAVGDEFLVNQTTSGNQQGASVAAMDSENFVVAWSGEGDGDSNGVFARQFGNQSGLTLSGQVMEDVNGDSDLSDGQSVSNASVALYRDGGDGAISADDILIRAATTTDGDGNYSFTGLNSNTTYWVVVDSKTIAPDDLNTGFGAGHTWAEQTFGDGGSKFGGLTAGISDDASTLLTAQHVSQVSLGNSNYTDVDFGFSFNVVTNTLGGDLTDHDLLADRTIQGTLRQFIANANAIDGENAMRFVPGVSPSETSGADAWWEIAVSQALPAILDAQTVIDGRAYDSADGVTLLNSNSMVHTAVLGADGIAGTGDEIVGVGADGVAGTGDEMVLSGVSGPDLEIRDILGVGIGLEIHGVEVEIANIAIHGFGQSGVNSGNIFVGTSADDVYIHDNVIGSEAGDFSIPSTSAGSMHGITVTNADDGVIEDNLIAFHGESGIRLVGNIGGTDNVEGWTIRNNQIIQNAQERNVRSGIDILRSENILITGNLVGANAGFGIDTYDSVGDITISENTVAYNGTSAARSAVRLFGNDNVVEHNLIASNNGAGVNIVSDYIDGLRTFVASTDNLISQNSFFNNSGVAIDQMSSPASAAEFNRGDGVSDNTTASDLNAGNEGVDHPQLTEAYLDGSGLNVFGTLDTVANFDRIEIYLANSGAGDTLTGVAYGEGEMYLGSIDLGDFQTLNAGGEFHALLDPPIGGWPAELTSSGTVTTIGIQNSGNTSEFSNVVLTNDIPDAAASEVTLDEDEVYVFDELDFDFVDSDDAVIDSVMIDSLTSNGDLYLSGVKIDLTSLPLTISSTDLDSGILTFEPDPDANGSAYASFSFRVSDGDAIGTSAIMTIHVNPINDAPVAMDDVYLTPEDTPRNVVTGVLFNDTDIDDLPSKLEATISIDPVNGDLTLKKDGTFTYTPDDNFFGTDTFEYEVTDEDGATDKGLVTINVLSVNDAPEFDPSTPNKVSVIENRFNVIQLSASDVELDPFAFSLATGMTDDNALFAINPANGKLVFRSPPDFENPGGISGDGTYDVNVQVTDIHGDRSVHAIEVKLINADEAPSANDDFIGVDEGQGIVIDVTANDTDPDNDFDRKFSTVSIVDGPSSGHAFVNAKGHVVYVHNGDEVFTDSITYEIVDMTGLTDTAQVTIVVNPIEDPTQVNDDYLGRLETGEQLIVSANVLLANDIDDDSVLNHMDIVLTGQPDNGHVEIIDGNLVFTPDKDFQGFVSFEYQVDSNGVMSDSAKAVVFVNQSIVVSTPDETAPETEEDNPDPIEDDPAPESNPGAGNNTTTSDDFSPNVSSSDGANATGFNDESELQTALETNEFKLNYVGATYAFASRVDDLALSDLASVWVTKDAVQVSQFETKMLVGLIWDDHDAGKTELISSKLQLGVSEIAASAASFLTVGYLAWIIRGGVLLTTFMSSIPAWSSLDILSVLETDGNESIEQMVDL